MPTRTKSHIRFSAARMLTRCLLAGALALAAAAVMGADFSQPVSFDIPPQTLSTALVQFADQAGVQFTAPGTSLDGLRSEGVRGRYPPGTALSLILRRTGLVYRIVDPSTVAITRPGATRAATPADRAGKEGKSRSSARFPLDRLAQGKAAGADLAVEHSPSGAASPAQPAGISQETLAEIVVTAQKSAQRLQDVPLSITALSQTTLQRMGIQSLAQVAEAVPGLNVVTVAPGQNEILIRGISSAGGIPTTGFYLDDTPLESVGNVAGNAMDPTMFGLERVEVLRGPQGTLYGDSSMGGTVRYITVQPKLDVTEGDASAELSDTDGGGLNYQASGTLNAPLIAGLAAVRATVFDRDFDGYIDRYPIDPNNYLAASAGPVDRNVNTEKTYGGRVSVRLQPVGGISVTPSVLFQRTDLGGTFTVDDPPGSFDDLIQTRAAAEPSSDMMQLYSLSGRGDFGATHVTSSTSYRARAFDAVEDDSKTSYYYFSPSPQTYVYPTPFWNRFSNHDFTEELRATSSAGPVHGILGLFYLRQSNLFTFNYPTPDGYNAAFGYPFGDQPFFVSTRHNLITQRAIYGQLTFDLPASFQVILGGRAFHISQDENDYYAGVFQGAPISYLESTAESGFTPKYELTYKATRDVLAYATAAKGFRQGGTQAPAGDICNADLQAIGLDYQPTSYNPDYIWNYELGIKSAWLDRRLVVNADVYYIDWKNVQQLIVLPTCGANIVGNFGTASSKGGELEIQAQVTDRLLLTLGVSYNQAKLLSTVAGAQGQPGDTLEDAPRWMGSATAEYDVQVRPSMAGYARLDIYATSDQFNSFDSASIWYRRSGYGLTNLRLGARDGGWDTALFVDNLFDRHVETALPVSYAVDLPSTRRLAINRPLTLGVDVRWQF